MRTREEIKITFNRAVVANPDMGLQDQTMAETFMEVLLDIRDLLTKEPR